MAASSAGSPGLPVAPLPRAGEQEEHQEREHRERGRLCQERQDEDGIHAFLSACWDTKFTLQGESLDRVFEHGIMGSMGDLSRNFSQSEFACGDCGHVEQIDRRLVEVLQRARTAKGKPLKVVSGFRCCAMNARVGGYRYSQHLYGRAADVPGGFASVAEWKSYGAVGIGVRGGRVIHVDVTPGRSSFVFND